MIQITPLQPTEWAAVGALAADEGFRLDPAEELERGHGLLWVARRQSEGEVEGYLLAWRVADEIELLQLVVRAAARRSGLGSALLEHLCAFAHRLPATAVHLEVRASNRAALGLYESRGFAETARRSGYYADGEDALLLTWKPDDSAAR